MKTEVQTITPERASKLLQNHLRPERQRPLSESVVESYARVMRAGHWMLTHQGIAIDDAGELIDGQHRLTAVVRSGVAVPMLVTTDIPHNGHADGFLTIDAIDRGQERIVGQQLQLRHGVTNGNLYASAARSVLWLAASSRKLMPGKFSVAQALRVRDYYGDELAYCMGHRSRDQIVRNGPIIGACAFAMKASPEHMRGFYHGLTTGEQLAARSPAMAARRWLMNRSEKLNTLTQFRVVLLCAMKYVLQEQISKAYFSMQGYDFFLARQRNTVKKLLLSCGFPE